MHSLHEHLHDRPGWRYYQRMHSCKKEKRSHDCAGCPRQDWCPHLSTKAPKPQGADFRKGRHQRPNSHFLIKKQIIFRPQKPFEKNCHTHTQPNTHTQGTQQRAAQDEERGCTHHPGSLAKVSLCLYLEGCSVAGAYLAVPCGAHMCPLPRTCQPILISPVTPPPTFGLDAINTWAMGGRAWEMGETRRQGTDGL